jgi:outer membrane protein assembly factor BamB
VLWKFKTNKFVFSSPSLCDDGTLLVGSDDGCLYALRTESAGPADSSWPKFRADAANRGVVLKKQDSGLESEDCVAPKACCK